MRSQKREFVVEYKSRRRIQLTPKSIWANIDLKAASKAVKADVDLLFKQKEPAHSLETVHLLGSVSAAEPGSSTSASSTKRGSRFSGSASTPVANEMKKTVAQAGCDDRPSTTQAPIPRRSARGRGGKRDLIAVDDNPVYLDELRDLQAENSRLKLALKTRLLRDNDVLRAMLERFER